MKFSFVRVVNGDKVWEKMGDDATALDDKDKIKEAKEEVYADWVSSLLPLVKGKGFKLEPLGEVKVDGKPAAGVRVSHEGHRDLNLFFSKDTGLLVKSEHTVKDFLDGGNEKMAETLYSDYKEVGGVKRPMKLVINHDGKKYVEAELSDYEAKEKIDASQFDKP